jgi:hypothetical protein
VNRFSSINSIGKRALSSSDSIAGTAIVKKNQLIEAYENNKLVCQAFEPKELINPKGVFANNEIDLKNIQIYGFDYDYTLGNFI